MQRTALPVHGTAHNAVVGAAFIDVAGLVGADREIGHYEVRGTTDLSPGLVGKRMAPLVGILCPIMPRGTLICLLRVIWIREGCGQHFVQPIREPAHITKVSLHLLVLHVL